VIIADSREHRKNGISRIITGAITIIASDFPSVARLYDHRHALLLRADSSIDFDWRSIWIRELERMLALSADRRDRARAISISLRRKKFARIVARTCAHPRTPFLLHLRDSRGSNGYYRYPRAIFRFSIERGNHVRPPPRRWKPGISIGEESGLGKMIWTFVVSRKMRIPS